MGVKPTDRVGIYLERSLHAPVAVLAVLRSGAAYVPLDPRYPADRLAFMLRDSQPRVLLTQESLRGALPFPPEGTLLLDGELGAPCPDTALPGDSLADGPAYVIYTSGSTGWPKGVTLGRRALANLLAWQCQDSRAAPGWRTLQFTPLSFDVHFQEFFSTWATGGTLVLIDEETRADPAGLLATVEREEIARLFLPFVALQTLAETACQRRRYPACLREVITAGEQLQITPALRGFFTHLPGCTLHNHYGPSETHVVTAYTLAGDPASWPLLPPIGRPLPGVQVQVLDRNGCPAAEGDAGELHLGGVALADGYHNRPELTAERFVNRPGGRFYRTGDLVRRLAGGDLEYLGRLDDQVKVRGHRIELGEIEARLREHPAVAQCAVALHHGPQEGRRLVAYWVPQQAGETAAAPLREHLRLRLPEYMVPAAFVSLASLPLTPSGKVDRKALPAPNCRREGPGEEYQAPRDGLESELAALWEDMLGVEQVGRTESFFDLGGDSLLAVRLLSRAEEIFGIELPLSALYCCPTIEHLAEGLRDGPRSAGRSHLVAIQPGGARPPFFCVPGAHSGNSVLLGYAPHFIKLARRLGPHQPFYSFCFEYPPGAAAAALTVERLAECLLRDVRAVQPNGPYLLGGWSFGGLVAVEMARQLRGQGAAVALLALFDTAGPRYPTRRPWAGQLVEHLRRMRALGLARGSAYVLSQVAGAARFVLLRARRALGRLLGRGKRNPWARVMRLETAYLSGLARCPGRLTLFVGTETLAASATEVSVVADPRLGWGAVAEEGVDMRLVRGGHHTLFEEPGLSDLAEALRLCLHEPGLPA
jgi:amino acid adenylation domain-containing protein